MTDPRRQAIIDWAKHEASVAGDGSHRSQYMIASGLDPNDHVEWCGIFTLAALKGGGIAADVTWKIGIGYVGPEHLNQTVDPQPGDIFYKDQPFQHYGLVTSLNADGSLDSIEGNAPGVKILHHPKPSGVVYYSIDKLLEKAGASGGGEGGGGGGVSSTPKADGSSPSYYLQLSAVSSSRDVLEVKEGITNRALVRIVQGAVGVWQDGDWGPITEAAVRHFLGIE